jgi:hypothetical protein
LVWQGSAMRRPPPGLGPVRCAYAPPSVEKLLGALPVVAVLAAGQATCATRPTASIVASTPAPRSEETTMPLPRWLARINKRIFNPMELRRGIGRC